MTEPELLRAILKSPDADEPRIAYAKLAKAKGDPRGEFIEAQLDEARKHREHTYAADWAPHARRAEAVLKTFKTLWLEPFSQVEGTLVTDLRFYRGFVEHVQMDARAFAEQSPEIYALAPIRHLTLTNVMAFPQALTSPHMSRIATLEVSSQHLDDAAVELLARSSNARRLRWMDFAINDLTLHGIEAICRSPHLRDLRYLSLDGNPGDDPIDTYTSEGAAIITTTPTSLGRELEARFGPLGWLHAPWFFGVAYPPNRDDAADS